MIKRSKIHEWKLRNTCISDESIATEIFDGYGNMEETLLASF